MLYEDYKDATNIMGSLRVGDYQLKTVHPLAWCDDLRAEAEAAQMEAQWNFYGSE